MVRNTLTPAIALIGALSPLAHAQFAHIEDFRWITIENLWTQFNDQGQAGWGGSDLVGGTFPRDFGDVDDEISWAEDEGTDAFTRAVISQVSASTPTGLSGSGSTTLENGPDHRSCSPSHYVESTWTTNTIASTFVLDQPMRVRVSGQVFDPIGDVEFWLLLAVEWGPRIVEFEDVTEAVDGVEASVWLEPGSYVWHCDNTTWIFCEPGAVHSSSFTASIEAFPEACGVADMNEPFGVLDLADVQSFISGFIDQAIRSDIAEPSGDFDLADLGAFVESFNKTCD